MTDTTHNSDHTEPVPDGGWFFGDDRTGSTENELRSPAVAGGFYAGSADSLRDQLEWCFDHELGPGTPRREPSGPTPIAIVTPHAGYQFSGPIAAHSFARLAAGDEAETVVILGPNHRKRGPAVSVASHDRWRTPLGSLPVDRGLASTIVERSTLATFDSRAHREEHSIEVQLPLLQYVLADVSIVPVCLALSDESPAERLGETIAASIAAVDRPTSIAISTDLTHYSDHETAVDADEPIVDAIRSLDSGAIADAARSGHTMCGPWATVAGLVAARRLGADEGERLQYATSGQTGGEPERVVGYCAAAVR